MEEEQVVGYIPDKERSKSTLREPAKKIWSIFFANTSEIRMISEESFLEIQSLLQSLSADEILNLLQYKSEEYSIPLVHHLFNLPDQRIATAFLTPLNVEQRYSALATHRKPWGRILNSQSNSHYAWPAEAVYRFIFELLDTERIKQLLILKSDLPFQERVILTNIFDSQDASLLRLLENTLDPAEIDALLLAQTEDEYTVFSTVFQILRKPNALNARTYLIKKDADFLKRCLTISTDKEKSIVDSLAENVSLLTSLREFITIFPHEERGFFSSVIDSEGKSIFEICSMLFNDAVTSYGQIQQKNYRKEKYKELAAELNVRAKKATDICALLFQIDQTGSETSIVKSRFHEALHQHELAQKIPEPNDPSYEECSLLMLNKFTETMNASEIIKFLEEYVFHTQKSEASICSYFYEKNESALFLLLLTRISVKDRVRLLKNGGGNIPRPTLKQLGFIAGRCAHLFPEQDWVAFVQQFPEIIIHLIKSHDISFLRKILDIVPLQQKEQIILQAIRMESTFVHDDSLSPIGSTLPTVMIVRKFISPAALQKLLLTPLNSGTYLFANVRYIAEVIPDHEKSNELINLFNFQSTNFLSAAPNDVLVPIIAFICANIQLTAYAAGSVFKGIPSARLEVALATKLENGSTLAQHIYDSSKFTFHYFLQHIDKRVYRYVHSGCNLLAIFTISELKEIFNDLSEEQKYSLFFEIHKKELIHKIVYDSTNSFEFLSKLFSIFNSLEHKIKVYKQLNSCLLAHAVANDGQLISVIYTHFQTNDFYKKELYRIIEKFPSRIRKSAKNLHNAVSYLALPDALEVCELPLPPYRSLLHFFEKQGKSTPLLPNIVRKQPNSSEVLLRHFCSTHEVAEEGQDLKVSSLFTLAQHLSTQSFTEEIFAAMTRFSPENFNKILLERNKDNQDIFQFILYKSDNAGERLAFINRLASLKFDAAVNHSLLCKSPRGLRFFNDCLQTCPDFIKSFVNDPTLNAFINNCPRDVLYRSVNEKDQHGNTALHAITLASEPNDLGLLLRRFSPAVLSDFFVPLPSGKSIVQVVATEKRQAIYSVTPDARLEEVLFSVKYNGETCIEYLITQKAYKDLTILTVRFPELLIHSVYANEGVLLQTRNEFQLELLNFILNTFNLDRYSSEISKLLLKMPFTFYQTLNETRDRENSNLLVSLISKNIITAEHFFIHLSILDISEEVQKVAFEAVLKQRPMQSSKRLSILEEGLKNFGIENGHTDDYFQAAKPSQSIQELNTKMLRFLKSLHYLRMLRNQEINENELAAAHPHKSSTALKELQGSEFTVNIQRQSQRTEAENNISLSREKVDDAYEAFVHEIFPGFEIKKASGESVPTLINNFFAQSQIPNSPSQTLDVATLNIRSAPDVQEFLAQIGQAPVGKRAIDTIITRYFSPKSLPYLFALSPTMALQPLLDRDWYQIAHHLIQEAMLTDPAGIQARQEGNQVVITEEKLRNIFMDFIERRFAFLAKQTAERLEDFEKLLLGDQDSDQYRNELIFQTVIKNESVNFLFRVLMHHLFTFYVDQYRLEKINLLPPKEYELDHPIHVRILDPNLGSDVFRILHLPEIAGGDLQNYPKQIARLAMPGDTLTFMLSEFNATHRICFGSVTLQLGYIEENGEKIPAIFQNEVEMAAYRSAQNIYHITRTLHEFFRRHFPGYRHIVNSPYEIYLQVGNGGKRITPSATLINAPLQWTSLGQTQQSPSEHDKPDPVVESLHFMNSLIEISDDLFVA